MGLRPTVRLNALLLLLACGPSTERADTADPVEPPALAATLPGDATQHHATLACHPDRCLVARQLGSIVAFSLLDDQGQALTQEQPPTPPFGWNHPEVSRWADRWIVLAAVSGAPTVIHLDPMGAPEGEPAEIHAPWPWGQWPDLALTEDGRAHALWSDKVSLLWRTFDPALPEPGLGESLPLAGDQAIVDPPAIVALPGGTVRAWTEVTGSGWELRVQWTDVTGAPTTEPRVVDGAPEDSRGTRPQLAARPDGTVALAWRRWPGLGFAPEGAFVQVFNPSGEPLAPPQRLDPDTLGDRPTVEALDDGWLIAWEEGEPSAVLLGELSPDGTPRPASARVVSDTELPAGRANLALKRTDARWEGFVSWEEVAEQDGLAITDAVVRVLPIAAGLED